MAAAPRLLLWLLLPLLWPPGPAPAEPHPGPSRRFSEHKLCADEECSMLMYRGEALQDFTGPDCRFVNFKKGDPVYVYYKLAGGAPEVWAGSVGRIFGYFPKDLIQIVHEYTKKELQLPTDETDFVCFDGGRDDFDNYNIEELLGSWELYDSAAGDPPGASDKPAHDPQKPPEASEESDPEPDPEETDSEEGETLSSEDTRDPEGRFEAQKRSHPHANDETDNPQGGWSSLNPFEEMLQERLKVPENENKTSNGSQASHEQEKIGAHKLLKTEVTLDWKTRFGSTADALVSDDETTRLVTSLEDDLDEELDADYDTVGREDEEGEDSFDELPLLTFTDEEDTKTPAEPGVEKYSAEGGKKSSKEDLMEVAPPPGIKDDKNTVPTPGGTVFSVVTGSKEKAGMMDLESSESEEEKDDVLLGPDSEWEDASSAMNAPDPELAGDGDLAAEVPETNDRDPGVDPELHAETKGRKIQEYKRGLAPDKTASEDDRKGEVTAHGSAQSSDRDSLLSAEKAKDTFESVFENKGKDPREAAVHISKETLHEEKPNEQILEGSAERESGHEAAGNQKEEEMKQDSTDTAAHVRDSQHDASKDGIGDVGAVVRAPGPHALSVGVQGEQFKKELVLETQNQSRIFTPGETGPPAKLEEEVSRQGRNVSRQQETDVAAAAHKHVDEKVRVSDGARHEDTSRTESAYHKTLQGTQVAGNTGQAGSKEVLGSQTGQPEAEGDDDIPEELLEDENALSAKEAKKDSSGVQDGRSGVDLQPPERAASETAAPEGETGENKAETGVILEAERKSDTVAKGADVLAGGPARMEGDKEESSRVGEKTHRPSEVSDSPDKQTVQTSELGDLFRNKDSDGLKEDSPEDQPKTSGFAEKPEVEELSKEDREDLEKFTGPESQWSTSEKLDGDLFHWATGKPEQGDSDKDLPIIRSFFKDQQSLQRFQKYFDVRELEAIFQEMSLKLKSARQETLPYNVEKVLDKVFRASESHILSVAEQMLDSRVAAQRELGIKEDSVFEEAAVLDDIQDLIYFVRYQHSAVEGTVLPVVTRPPEDSWDGPVEGSAEELKMQAPEESGHWDQPVSSDTAASEGTGDMAAPGVSQTPTTEIGSDPEIISREGMPLDVKQQLETNAEESPSATPLEKGLLYVCSFVFRLTATLVATLPDDVQPGPDFYGLPWKPVLITAFLGIVSFAIFFWRTILAVKNRVYQVSEQEITEKLKNIKKENEELKEKLSNYEQKIRESKKHVQETKKQNTILSDEAIKFKDKIKELELNNEVLDEKAKSLHVLLESEREQNVKNQDLILENEKSIEKLKEVIAVNASEFSEVQIALNEAKLSEEKVKSECHRVQEENAKLTKKKEQLQQEIQDWSEAHAGLTEQIKAFQRSQEGLEVALSHKDDSIDALTNCLTQLNRLDCESESDDKNRGGSGSDELANGETGGDWSEKMKNQIKQMMDVSRTKTAISVVEEDLKLLQIKLRASMSTKCNLEDQIKRLEEEREVLQSTRAGLEDECKTLKQKVEILNELYQQKEMALQKKLSQEEYERQEKEQRLSAADERAVLAAEEVKTYKRRVEEMEDELQKTERSFKSQIAAHEKKAHDNWLKARAAERAIAEEKREAANLRHKLLEITQKMAMLQEEPVIVKPLPGRPNAQNPPRRGPLSQNGSFGPSPVSGGECSPPLTVDPPVRPPSANLSRREMTRGPLDGPPPRPRWPPDAPGKASVSAEAGAGAGPLMNSSSGSSSPKVMDDGKQTVPQEPEGPSVPSTAALPERLVAVNMAAKGPPPFPGVPLPPPVRYGPPPQLGGPFGPQPLPPPFAPGLRPPLGLREYAPGIPPGKRDLPLDPREFLPGHTPFRPLGPRAFFIPGTRLPPPPHGPQDYPPLPAARDVLPPGSRDEPPSAAAQSSSQDSSQALKQSP